MADIDREEDLDKLEEELGQPFVHEPEELDIGEGQTCFLNQDRRCMSDCTSYNLYADVPQGPERCVLLVYASHVAVNTKELVELTKKAAGLAKTKADDTARAQLANMPIPDPFGGKAP